MEDTTQRVLNMLECGDEPSEEMVAASLEKMDQYLRDQYKATYMSKQIPVELYCESRHGAPEYAHMFDSGMDVRAFLPDPDKSIILYPHAKIIVPTGLYFAIPVGFEFQVRPRSGLSWKTSVKIVNSPGTIDCPYRGELGIIVENHGNQFEIKDGDRIAQLVLAPVYFARWVMRESKDQLSETPRGDGGFGSTGKN